MLAAEAIDSIIAMEILEVSSLQGELLAPMGFGFPELGSWVLGVPQIGVNMVAHGEEWSLCGCGDH